MGIMNVTTVAPTTVSIRTDRNRQSWCRCVRRTGRPRGLDPGLAPRSKIEVFRYCGGAVVAIPSDAMPEYLLKFYMPRGDARVAPDDGASARAAAEELTRARSTGRPPPFNLRPGRGDLFRSLRGRVGRRRSRRGGARALPCGRISAVYPQAGKFHSQHRRGPLSSTSHPSGGDHAHLYATTAQPILRLPT
jgi:hypothetical protein